MAAGHLDVLYLPGTTPLHRMPAQVKIAAMVLFVFAVVATPPQAFGAFAAYAGVLALMAAVARIPPGVVLRRAVIEVPFLAFAVLIPFVAGGPQVQVLGLWLSEPGLLQSWNIVVKGTLGVVASVVLASTTEVRDLLVGLRRLHVPEAFVSIVGFMIRYVDVVTAEAQRMSIARQSRGYEPRTLWQVAALAHSVGSLFVRSYERGERVYLAMLSRGFSGAMPVVEASGASPRQWAAGLAVPAFAACVMVAAHLGIAAPGRGGG